MLNITTQSITKHIDRTSFKAYKNLQQRSSSKYVIRILLVFLLVFIISLLLPWTQNIRSKGYVTTLNPYDKPQNIQALIGGKINKWYVTEGDIVAVGDTIAMLSEAKAEYLDPELLDNTKTQELAKSHSADAYLAKSQFLTEQLTAIKNNRDSKLNQLQIKQKQIDLEIKSTESDLEAAITYAENAAKQLERMQLMYDKGIKSLTDLETKKLSNREAIAKQISVKNKLDKLSADKESIVQQVDVINADFKSKRAKTESEIQSADSYRFSLMGETTKLRSKYNQITQRQNALAITSPINGRITKVLKNGIGEFVKSQETITTIVPTNFQKAVELYIEPYDMPLIQIGKKVRLQFDGWPAVIFSGWPDNSFGTFGGEVFAIDNDISENGKYRILVTESDEEKLWPDLIRIGSGARGILLLNDVKIYYEIWRKLNGFPPDFYSPKSKEDFKNKAPIRKVK